MINAFSKLPMRCTTLFNGLGALCGWLLLALVFIQFSVVIGRYLLGINFLWAQELALYLHASIFLLGAGWTLMRDRHVRIDLFYARVNNNRRRFIQRLGFMVLLVPAMLAVIIYSFGYAVESWKILEGSREISGLPGVFLVKTLIPVFAGLMLVAGALRVLSFDD